MLALGELFIELLYEIQFDHPVFDPFFELDQFLILEDFLLFHVLLDA